MVFVCSLQSKDEEEAYSGAAGSKLHTFAVYFHEMEKTKLNANTYEFRYIYCLFSF